MAIISKKNMPLENLILVFIVLLFSYSAYVFFNDGRIPSPTEDILAPTNGTYRAMDYYTSEDFKAIFSDVSIKEIPDASQKVFYGPLSIGGNRYFIIDTYGPGNDVVSSAVIDTVGKFQDDRVSKKILGLRNFYELTKVDPLFYSMHTSPANMNDLAEIYDGYESRVKSMRNEELKAIYSQYESGNKPLLLIPHDFLKSVPSVVDATETFYGNPSYENADKLIDKYEQASDSYINDSSRILKVLEDFRELNANISGFSTRIVSSSGFESATNLETTIGDLRLILENGYALRIDVQKRKSVLGYGEHQLDMSYLMKDVIVPQPDDAIHKVIVSKKEIYSYIPEIQDENKRISGPFELETPCFGWDSNLSQKKMLYYYGLVFVNDSWDYSSKMSSNAERRAYHTRIQNMSDIDPVRLETKKDAAGAFMIVPGKGLKINEMMYCQCNGLGEDMVELTTLGVFHDLLNTKRIYTSSVSKPSVYSSETIHIIDLLEESQKKGDDLERQFLYNSYPSESLLNELGKNYLNTYLLLSELEDAMHHDKGKVKSLAGDIYDKKETLLEYSSVIKGKLFAFDKNRDFQWKVANSRIHVSSKLPDGNPLLILDMMPYSLTFMPWSESVWRISEKPQYMIKKNYPPKYLIETS